MKEIKLYNVLFPLWMLLMFPTMWLIVLPGNFLIDSIVLLILMKVLNICEKKEFYKKNILKIYLIGLLADAVGAVLLFITVVTEVWQYEYELYFSLVAMVISAILIFLLNYYITFSKCEKRIKMKLALTFAIVTAPYTFLVPTSWLYNF